MMADLSRHVHLPLEFDFMAVSSYGAATQTSGVVRILKDLDHEIEGRHVLLVEDIINTGLTIDYTLSELRRRHPASLEVVTLLDRPLRRLVQTPVRYVGFQIPNDYVVGYGLDYRELYRNLPFICTLRTSVFELPPQIT
jgi:hypoxanthine phosphoribosyltransferase